MPAASDRSGERSPAKPILCYVTDRKSLGAAAGAASTVGLEEKIRAAVAAGADWVQIREKDLPGRELLTLVRRAVALGEARRPSARVIVNDRLDIALAAGASGVHLGGESLPAGEVAAWRRARNAPHDFLVGVSCHSLEDALASERAGADYVFFGPVFVTPSKEAFGAPQGVALLAEVCRSVGIPVIAIGGVDEINGPECLRSGAAGIAAIRLFQAARKPGELKDAISRLRGSRWRVD